MKNRVIFMGTPDFAVPSLQKLVAGYEVVAVVTQPDRRSGRGKKMVFSPVKQTAVDLGLPIIQPETLREKSVVAQLEALRPDVIIVAAFGQILRRNVLDMPAHGCINVHASLLPRWRGAAPVAAAIRAGDTETGVTLMKMDRGLDTGPMLRAKAISITQNHTRASLTDQLAILGAELLIETLPAWLGGDITAVPQNDEQATLAPRIQKEEGLIDWHQPASEIERHIRAFDPWPGTYTFWQGQRLKIVTGSILTVGAPHSLSPGAVFQAGQNVAVKTGDQALALGRVQLAGKKAMAATDLVRGLDGFLEAQLG